MKKIGKLQVNPEKLMKNEELLCLKGGYGGYVTCRTASNEICYSGSIDSCSDEDINWACYFWCPEHIWESAICAG